MTKKILTKIRDDYQRRRTRIPRVVYVYSSYSRDIYSRHSSNVQQRVSSPFAYLFEISFWFDQIKVNDSYVVKWVLRTHECYFVRPVHQGHNFYYSQGTHGPYDLLTDRTRKRRPRFWSPLATGRARLPLRATPLVQLIGGEDVPDWSLDRSLSTGTSGSTWRLFPSLTSGSPFQFFFKSS